MKYDSLPSSFFIDNRKKFSEKILVGSIGVFLSNDESPRTADQTYFYRQNSDFYYLTGIDQEQSALLIFPSAPTEKEREILYIRKANEHLVIWEGEKLSIEKAKEISGVKTVRTIEHLQPDFARLMLHATACYLNMNEHDRSSLSFADAERRFALETKERFPLHRLERAAPIMHTLRSIKAPIEVETLRHAIYITEKAFRRVLGFVKGGVYEYEVEAEIMHEFLRNRATGYAYYPIIASGKDSCYLHYNKNNKICLDGDILLMDFGAEYANYNADLTRTIPVSGRYTHRQRDVYEAVLRVQREAMKLLRPGKTLDEVNRETGKIMESELLMLGLLKREEVENQNPDQPLYKKYYMHGVSHFLGLDVHDVGNRYAPIKAGMVFTVEPGIYIQEEKLGIRLENNILVTEEGYEDLMANIPIEIEEIEDLMNQ